MGKARLAGGIEEKTTTLCPKCDPPEALRRELGSRIGQYRAQHYLDYHSTDGLEQHLRGSVSRSADPEKGYGYDQWLSGVLLWHRVKQRWREQDESRWPEIR